MKPQHQPSLRLPSRPGGAKLITSSLDTPTLDNRQYRVLRLPNDLEVVIIHDPTTDRASAALDVAVGSSSDPDSMPGMAHAVEHLLFMGTEKYPEDNAYNSFLNQHGGWSNAYTASTSTNFYFEMAAGRGEKDATKEGEKTAGTPPPVDPGAEEEVLSTPTTMTKKDVDYLHVDTKPVEAKLVDGASEALSPTAATAATTTTPGQATDQPTPLYGALDRFSQFFISPLFDASCLDRELNAVDSENKGNLQKDGRRIMQLCAALANPAHPYSKFTTGNLETLRDIPKAAGIDVRTEFINFYEREYSANRMKLCVLGRESLDELEKWIVELFSPIPNKNLKELKFSDVPLLTEKELLTITMAKPIMDYHNLEIGFPCLAEDELWECQPNHYLSHLIGHEGKGSILSYLKAKGWADSLSAGASRVCPGSYFFDIDIDLTEEGLPHYEEIVKIVFQYIALLHATGPLEFAHSEIRDIAEIDFRFSENATASTTTGGLSSVMQALYLPREFLLSGYALIRKFDPELITKALSFLRPDNFRLILTSQKAPSTFLEKEKWYGTEYSHEKLPISFLNEIDRVFNSPPPSSLTMPEPNEYIASPGSLTITKPADPPKIPNKVPRILLDTPYLRLFHKADDTFFVPRTNVYIHFRSPIANASPYHGILASLFCDLFADAMTERTYAAGLAGLGYSLRPKRGGLTVCFWGYTPKLPLYLRMVLEAMVGDLLAKEMTEARFRAVKEALRKSLANDRLRAPNELVGGVVAELVSNVYWSVDNLLEALGPVELEDVIAHQRNFFTPVHVLMLVHGSMDKSAARTVSETVLSVLPKTKIPLLPSQLSPARCVILPAQSSLRIERPLADPAQKDNVVSILLLTGRVAVRRNWCLTALFNTFANERAFQRLRTELQLGYTVYTTSWNDGYTCAWRVVVQGSRPVEEVEGKMEAWLHSLGGVLTELSEVDFEGIKTALIAKKMARYDGLGQESGSLWGNIGGGMWDFEESAEDCEVIRGLGLAEFREWFGGVLRPGCGKREKLCVRLLSQVKEAGEGKDDAKEEKKSDDAEVAGEAKESEDPEGKIEKSKDSVNNEQEREDVKGEGVEEKMDKIEKDDQTKATTNGEKKDEKAEEKQASAEEDDESWKTEPVTVIDDIWKFKTTLLISPAVQSVMQVAELLDGEEETKSEGVEEANGDKEDRDKNVVVVNGC